MITENLSREDIIQKYSQIAKPLFAYLPWLENSYGKSAKSVYDGEGIGEHSLAFPVYDTNLLNFVNTASRTELMDRNYAYAYSRNGLKNVRDELHFIERAKLWDMDTLGGILSKYVLGGRTKGILWNQAVENGVFLHLVLKIKSLLEYREELMK